MNLFDEAFGKLIKSEREIKGWSQEQLAALVGLSRVSIANIEAGKQKVSFGHAVALSNKLGISLQKFQAMFGDAELKKEMSAHPEHIQQELMNALNKEGPR